MISITFKRRGGDTLMCVDATEFHKYLQESLGVKVNDYDGQFENRPAGASWIDVAGMRVMPYTLLKREWGAGGVNKSEPFEISLRSSFTRQPPTYAQLQQLGNSVEHVARDIVEHYRPIDITVRIVGKTDKPITPVPDVSPVPSF